MHLPKQAEFKIQDLFDPLENFEIYCLPQSWFPASDPYITLAQLASASLLLAPGTR
jgi:hypothetical protein